jgi:hypothetical protein
MRRRLLTCLSALSLILCVGTAVLWVRSGTRSDRVGVRRAEGGLCIAMSCSGRLSIAVFHRQPWIFTDGFESERLGSNWPAAWAWGFPNSGDPKRSGELKGFAWAAGQFEQPGVGMTLLPGQSIPIGSYRAVAVPHWFLCILFAAVPVIASARSRARRLSQAQGFCSACGYDLRVTPLRCPECGTVPTQEARTTA